MIQFLTRTVWWAIPTIWLPVVCWCISMSVKMGHTFPEIALMVVFGIFIWTFIEYTLHRFLFHIKTKSYWLVLISFKAPFSMYLIEIMKLDAPFSSILENGNTYHDFFYWHSLQGKHHPLSSSWLSSQAPYGRPAACVSSCCNSCVMCPG